MGGGQCALLGLWRRQRAATRPLRPPPPHARYGYPGECSRCSGAPSPDQCNYGWGAKDVAGLISDITQFRAPWVRGNDISLQFGAHRGVRAPLRARAAPPA